jgi:hypothetical protein
MAAAAHSLRLRLRKLADLFDWRSSGTLGIVGSRRGPLGITNSFRCIPWWGPADYMLSTGMAVAAGAAGWLSAGLPATSTALLRVCGAMPPFIYGEQLAACKL